MSRKITIQLFLVLFVASLLILPTAAGAATSSRTLPASVNVGAPITVSITVADYGTFGGIVETIPNGFTYDGSTLSESQVIEDGNSVKFILYGETNFKYTVTAPSTEGTYIFSGIVTDEDLYESTVGGDTSMLLVSEDVEQDSVPDEQTSTPSVPATQIESESVDSETIDEIPDEPTKSETSVDDVTNESSKSVKTTPSTESTEDIPATESTPFIATFGIILIGIIATLVHKLKK